MIAPIKPPDEAGRVAELHALGLLHTKYEQRFDRITVMATRIFKVPIAFVSFIAEEEQWFKSCVGMDGSPTTRDVSFCGHTILRETPLVIEDATKDERFQDNPSVIGPPYIRFYAGRPLHGRGGHKIGTLCIVDTKPRSMSADDLDNLNDLAVWVEREMGRFDQEKKHAVETA